MYFDGTREKTKGCKQGKFIVLVKLFTLLRRSTLVLAKTVYIYILIEKS